MVWGGDWNHELTGRLFAGSIEGRARILRALDDLGLAAPTDTAPHRIPPARSINHVAVPAFWTRVSGLRRAASFSGGH